MVGGRGTNACVISGSVVGLGVVQKAISGE